jgi:hypothetical protein
VRWATWKRWRVMTQSPPEPYRGPAIAASNAAEPAA